MTADNLNNVRVIPDLLVINENVRPSKVAYRQFDDKSKTWIGVTWKEFADMVRSWRKAFTASGLKKGDHAAVLLPNSITATACENFFYREPLKANDLSFQSQYDW